MYLVLSSRATTRDPGQYLLTSKNLLAVRYINMKIKIQKPVYVLEKLLKNFNLKNQHKEVFGDAEVGTEIVVWK